MVEEPHAPRALSKSFSHVETQTNAVRVIEPGHPAWDVVETMMLQLSNPTATGAPAAEATSSPKQKAPKPPAKASLESAPTKEAKRRGSAEKENVEDIFASDDEMLNDELLIDVEGDASETSDFEPSKGKGKSKGKAKATPKFKAVAKKKVTAAKASAKKGKAKEEPEKGKRRATEELEDVDKGKKKKTAAALKKSTSKGKHSQYAPVDPDEMQDLYLLYPDTYWSRLPGPDEDPNTMINHINEAQPLIRLESADIRDHGHITSMILSPDGRMLVTFCTMGTVRIWDCETWKVVQVLKDEDEENIDEFYCGRFTPTLDRLVVGGKLKDPKKWSEEDDDNHILPCPLKVFDVLSGKVVERLEGHEEEILCIKAVEFKGAKYFVTTSQDGYIIKWKMGGNWSGLEEYTRMEDGETCMAFNVSFLPKCGNKYFVAACDGGINLFDFEFGQKLQTFPNIYSCYCDCTKVVECLDYPLPPRNWDDVLNSDGNKDMFAYLISRGVEEVQLVDGGDVGINTVPNTVTLHKIVYPGKKGEDFSLQEVKRFQHDEYRSNSWLTKISSNGRYVFAPTYDGAVVIFNMASGLVTGILRDHDGVEVRDVVFGWRRKWVATCGDDGTVKVYIQGSGQGDAV